MSFLRFRKTIEYIPPSKPATINELERTASTVAALWSTIRDCGNGTVWKGFDVSFDNQSGRAIVAKRFTDMAGAIIAISQDAAGRWNVRQSQYKPVSEHVPNGTILMTTTNASLAYAGGVIRDTTVYKKMRNGELVFSQQQCLSVQDHVTSDLARSIMQDMVMIAEASPAAFDPNVV